MATHYFTTTTQEALQAELNDFIRVPGSLDIEYMRPAITAAQNNHLNEILGEELSAYLLTEVVPDPEASGVEYIDRELLTRVREPLAHLSVIAAIPMINLKVGAGGLTSTNNEKESTVQWWQYRDFKKALQSNAVAALDRLLIFLEKKGGQFEDYEGSAAQKANNANFVNTTAKARALLPVVKSPYVLRAMRPAMQRADELVLKRTLTPALYTALKDLSAAGDAWTITAIDYEPLRPHVEAVEMHLAFAESLDEGAISWTEEYGVYVPIIAEVETAGRLQQSTMQQREELSRKHSTYAARAVNELAELLKGNPDDFPLYAPATTAAKPFIKQGAEEKKEQNIYKGIGLP